MQKLGAGKGRGAGGMPSPAQMAQLQVIHCQFVSIGILTRTLLQACYARWNERSNGRYDESDDGRTGPSGYGRNAKYVSDL